MIKMHNLMPIYNYPINFVAKRFMRLKDFIILSIMNKNLFSQQLN